jgi:NADH-quinone oxidoreductase subunit N
MIAYRVKDRLSLEAGIKYLMLSGVSSALLLFGMALIYGEVGVLSFQQLSELSISVPANPLLLIGVILIIAAVGFKLSLVPFHLWTPDVYQGAPAPVMAFVATVSKGAVFALLLRFFISAQADRSDVFLDILSLIAAASILAGNLLALLQTNLKRMLAYSSIAHMGYLLVALIAGSVLQTVLLTESVGFYLLAYVITNLGAIGVVSAFSNDSQECEELEAYNGLFWRDPWLATILTLNLLSLAGIPLTVGFIGKFYVFAAGVSAALWTLVGAVVIGSGIGLYYYLRVVLVMLKPADAESQRATSPAVLAKLALASLALVLLWSGIYPQPFVETLHAIAKTLS